MSDSRLYPDGHHPDDAFVVERSGSALTTHIMNQKVYPSYIRHFSRAITENTQCLPFGKRWVFLSKIFSTYGECIDYKCFLSHS